MTTLKAHYKKAMPYKDDELNLPVNDLDAAIPFYEKVMGFKIESRSDSPVKKAMMVRDDIRIGLAENGGDPSQEGCVFEVDNTETAFQELQANGLNKKEPGIVIQRIDNNSWKVFFVIAPDGLCYCLGERNQ